MPRGFEVVPQEFKQNKRTAKDPFTQEPVVHYPNILLPQRGTQKSAGYDFFMPIDIILLPAQKIIIWSDVRAYMEDDEYLAMHIRSSLGIKKGLILSNVTGIIDSDYYDNPATGGNIGLALLNTSGVGIELKAGERVAQGIFSKYLLAENDNPLNTERVGGSGSTNG